MQQKYEPYLKSIRKHQVPDWFHDAKFGIFIHWSLSSVPAYAPVGMGDITELLEKYGWEGNNKYNAYAEWYLNTMKIEGSPTQEYHRETYGNDFPYDNFAPVFNKDIESWDPVAWAELFAEVGAKYVVLVTKHHDGFLLWPSQTPNPNKPGFHAKRDVVRELSQAVKERGMRMGLYYSGALDWSFNPAPITDLSSFVTNGPVDKEYGDYVDSHFRELIDRYQPSILWNDIGYPPAANPYDLFAYFYNKTPDGLINDRWIQVGKNLRKLITFGPLARLISWISIKAVIKNGIAPPKPRHSDYATPEYTTLNKIATHKWECVRGIGHSFGYNRMEPSEQYLKSDEAIRMLADIVSKNGNLLLNIGPRSDGSFCDEQIECVKGVGQWLKTNGEAIFGTRPWTRAEGKTATGQAVRFTKKDDTLFAILLDTPSGPAVVIEDLEVQDGSRVRLLGGATLEWRRTGTGIELTLPEQMPESAAHVLAITK